MPQIIAMVHVGSNSCLSPSAYSSLFNHSSYTAKDLILLEKLRSEIVKTSNEIVQETGSSLFNYCRNACFVLKPAKTEKLKKNALQISLFKNLVKKAIEEVDIYYANGIRMVEVENVGAPYFIGNEIPLEELLIVLLVADAIRNKYPDIGLGIQLLSCGELEALPIAIACKANFVRSEASIFNGLRPEGETNNRGNLAKFYYLRNYLNTKAGFSNPLKPSAWCDFQKKHTLFNTELKPISVWLENVLFQKIEGLVLTGKETGSAASEIDLELSRNFINNLSQYIVKTTGQEIKIPLISGSGANVEMYAKYVDYMIIGSAFKINSYWENKVSEKQVKALIKRVKNIHN